ncbi:MAG: two-component sensor histidine kinase, partial [Eubacterium sp.]|nr:two-component sensor histidine kinase [Eubacterium sp.]
IKSLRAQSMVVLLAVGLIPLVVFSFILMSTFRSKAVDQRVSELQSRGTILCNLVISSAFFSNDITSEVDSELTQVSDIYDGRILVVDSSLEVLRDTYGLEEGKTLILEDVVNTMNQKEVMIVNTADNREQIIIPVLNSDRSVANGAIIMDCSMNRVTKLYENLQTVSFTMIILLGVIVIVASVLYSGQIVKPMKEATVSISQITQGDFNDEMELSDFAESQEMQEAFEQMVSGLQNLEDARQEFVSNVSHELKTPITSVKVLAESLIGQQDVPVELYQEFMVDINNELERMNKIINDLLSLVRMDKSASQVNIIEVNVNEFVEGILKQLRPIAEQRNIDIIFESARPVTAQIDDVKMEMAIRNLIVNAIKYNYDNGWVRVSLNADHKFFYLKVSDSGVGIPEELQDSIFERFYRVDKARSRETGGNGLGLAITRSAILLHRGSIKVHSIEQQGTTFNVRIPLIYIE